MKAKNVTALQSGRIYSTCGAIMLCAVLLLVTSPLLAKDARNGAASPGLASDAAQKYPPTIVFMTDFGVVDDSVALCRGVMYSIMPDVRIVDLTHQVTPFSIADGARF